MKGEIYYALMIFSQIGGIESPDFQSIDEAKAYIIAKNAKYQKEAYEKRPFESAYIKARDSQATIKSFFFTRNGELKEKVA